MKRYLCSATRRVGFRGGHSLLEITVGMAIAGIVSTGFFAAFQVMSKNIVQQSIVSNYQDNVREGLYQVARDLRLAGANPTANYTLFDGIPASDVAIDIDPDHNGDISDAVLVRADKTGSIEDEGDGDTDDEIETIMYHWDRARAMLMRHSWKKQLAGIGTEVREHDGALMAFDASPFLEGICSFQIGYLDSANQPTTDPESVASMDIDIVSASGPGECYDANSFTRHHYAAVRVRNR